MAIGWLTVLQSVPWSEVIRNAPKVVDGAKKLWSTVAKKPISPEDSEPAAQPTASSEPQTLAALQSRVIALESTVAELHGQMLASTELIKTLADQNAQLIRRIETNRKYMLWLTALTTAVAAVALFGLFS